MGSSGPGSVCHFVCRGLRLSLKAPDIFGSYLALGLTLIIGLPGHQHGGGERHFAHQGAVPAVS